jgi:hypothetical protein
MKAGSPIGAQSMPFEFVSKVEVFDCDMGVWKVINYIAESNKLRIVNPGTY